MHPAAAKLTHARRVCVAKFAKATSGTLPMSAALLEGKAVDTQELSAIVSGERKSELSLMGLPLTDNNARALTHAKKMAIVIKPLFPNISAVDFPITLVHNSRLTERSMLSTCCRNACNRRRSKRFLT